MFCFASFFSISNCFLSNVSGGAVEQVEHIRGGRESRNVSPLVVDVATKELSKATKTDVEDKGGGGWDPEAGNSFGQRKWVVRPSVQPQSLTGVSERIDQLADQGAHLPRTKKSHSNKRENDHTDSNNINN